MNFKLLAATVITTAGLALAPVQFASAQEAGVAPGGPAQTNDTLLQSPDAAEPNGGAMTDGTTGSVTSPDSMMDGESKVTPGARPDSSKCDPNSPDYQAATCGPELDGN